jgi:hypothetical protein
LRVSRSQSYAIRAHRLSNVLDLLWSEILVAQSQLVLDVVIDRARDTDATREGEAFQSRSNIHPIAVQSFPLDNHIAQVDANAKVHLAMLG